MSYFATALLTSHIKIFVENLDLSVRIRLTYFQFLANANELVSMLVGTFVPPISDQYREYRLLFDSQCIEQLYFLVKKHFLMTKDQRVDDVNNAPCHRFVRCAKEILLLMHLQKFPIAATQSPPEIRTASRTAVTRERFSQSLDAQ